MFGWSRLLHRIEQNWRKIWLPNSTSQANEKIHRYRFKSDGVIVHPGDIEQPLFRPLAHIIPVNCIHLLREYTGSPTSPFFAIKMLPMPLVQSVTTVSGTDPLKYGGERGIRTLDTLLTYTPLAGERLQPLGHLSVDKYKYVFTVRRIPGNDAAVKIKPCKLGQSHSKAACSVRMRHCAWIADWLLNPPG